MVVDRHVIMSRRLMAFPGAGGGSRDRPVCFRCVRFVKLVKTKTPKLTLYTERAKCVLMENGPVPDFVASFYDGQCLLLYGSSLFIVSPIAPGSVQGVP